LSEQRPIGIESEWYIENAYQADLVHDPSKLVLQLVGLLLEQIVGRLRTLQVALRLHPCHLRREDIESVRIVATHLWSLACEVSY